MATLREFLSELATDPTRLGEFILDPDAAMSAAELSEADKAALRSGFANLIAARLAGLPAEEAFAATLQAPQAAQAAAGLFPSLQITPQLQLFPQLVPLQFPITPPIIPPLQFFPPPPPQVMLQFPPLQFPPLQFPPPQLPPQIIPPLQLQLFPPQQLVPLQLPLQFSPPPPLQFPPPSFMPLQFPPPQLLAIGQAQMGQQMGQMGQGTGGGWPYYGYGYRGW
jgi:hypothetical protein